jgi:hypothetical protein
MDACCSARLSSPASAQASALSGRCCSLSWQGAFLIKGLELPQGSVGVLGAFRLLPAWSW